MIIYLIWIAVLAAVLKLYFKKTYSRFSDHGVKHLDVTPLFGNIMKLIFRKEHFADNMDETYYKFPEERFVGKYEFTKPVVVLRDLDLVKKVTVKDFEHFLDHRGVTDERVEPLFARNLISLKGQEWKDMRSTLSPAFTSSKIKLMIPFMEEVGDQMMKSLKLKIKKSSSDYIDIDCKDLTTRYANDVIASCAFGLKVDSHTDENNKFYEMGKLTSTFTIKRMLLFFAFSSCPSLAKKLNLTMISNTSKDFFMNLVLSTMRDREDRNIIRPDMIHLLMEAKKGKLIHEDKSDEQKDTGFATVEESSVGRTTNDRDWSDVDLVAQAVLFFIAGFETISTAMSFALHELAIHSDIQERLAQEIKKNNGDNGGKLNFNSIQNMNYMDMVTSEVLRLWPPGMALDRLCVKNYNMGKPNDKCTSDYIMRKGEILSIPVWNFHRDSKYFPNPTKFDPERFSDENKNNIHSMAYMPFGQGPRNCIGSRFALCELKTLLYQILLHMEVSPSEKTQLPAKLSKESFNPRLEGGHWLRFKARN